MTPQESYRVGFLLRCAEEGLSEAQTAARVKQAAITDKSALFGAGAAASGGKKVLGDIYRKLQFLGLAGPPLLGVLGGYTLAKARDDMFDIDEAKREEELSEYQQAIARLKQSRQPAVA